MLHVVKQISYQSAVSHQYSVVFPLTSIDSFSHYILLLTLFNNKSEKLSGAVNKGICVFSTANSEMLKTPVGHPLPVSPAAAHFGDAFVHLQFFASELTVSEPYTLHSSAGSVLGGSSLASVLVQRQS